jgi:Flp pilus assembly CpaE family ATPase
MPPSAEATKSRPLTVLKRDHIRVQEAAATPVDLGPLLAVCGLTGGAGATTLAYLVALAAAEQDDGPVLVADTGGPSGGLAALAGVATSHSLVELAAQIAGRRPLEGGVYTTGPAGVRVLATGPEFTTTSAHEQLVRLLVDAREAHRLTVIDCGTLARDADRIVLAAATHVAWVLPATKNGIDRGRRVLEAAPAVAARPLIVGRRDVCQSKAPLRELRRIASERPAPLVLVPHLPELESRKPDRAVETAQVPLQAIVGALMR